MQTWVNGLLGDQTFWQALFAVAAGFVFWPGGVVQKVLTALGGKLEAWAQQRLPASQYALLKALAEDACRAVWQEGSAYGWSNTAKKDAALSHLKAVAANHGINLNTWGPTLGPIIEAVWSDLKPLLPGAPSAGESASSSANTAAPTVAASAASEPDVQAALASASA